MRGARDVDGGGRLEHWSCLGPTLVLPKPPPPAERGALLGTTTKERWYRWSGGGSDVDLEKN